MFWSDIHVLRLESITAFSKLASQLALHTVTKREADC